MVTHNLTEIQEGNKLIHCFMHPKDAEEIRTFADWWFDDKMYHTSWDWLMPVVEKIESINGKSCGLWAYFDVKDVLRVGTENNSFKVKNADKDKITATWRTVIDFIKWYNQNK